MKEHSQRYGFLESVVLSMAALGIYNCVIQFLLYPALNRRLGTEVFGEILTLLSIQTVPVISAGAGVNYARMANVPHFKAENGDYNRCLLVCFGLIASVSVGTLCIRGTTYAVSFILYPVLGIVTALRYYASVAFRLEINYRKNFVFYILLSVGYLLGMLVFRLTSLWETALLAGEVLAVFYVLCTSPVLRRPYLKTSPHAHTVYRSCGALVFSQIFCYLTLNADRLLIGSLRSGTEVTIFYTASLLGKAMAMLTEPIAGVAIGYLARSKGFGRKQFLLCSGAGVFAGLAACAVFVPLSPFLIGILYPDIAADAAPYFLIANSGQILYFVANLLLVILLRFTKEKYQLYINIVYCAAFFAACIPALLHDGLSAFCKVVLLLNIARLAAVLLLGILKSPKDVSIGTQVNTIKRT